MLSHILLYLYHKYVMYKLFHLDCFKNIQISALNELNTTWDFKTEKIIRISNQHYIYKILSDEFKSLDLPDMLGCSIFSRGPNQTQVLHCDSMPNGDKVNSAIIIPIIGTVNSKFQWFSNDGATILQLPTPDKKSIFYKVIYPLGIPNPIAEIEILEPILANVRNPHRAISSKTSPRAVISIKFIGNPFLI